MFIQVNCHGLSIELCDDALGFSGKGGVSVKRERALKSLAAFILFVEAKLRDAEVIQSFGVNGICARGFLEQLRGPRVVLSMECDYTQGPGDVGIVGESFPCLNSVLKSDVRIGGRFT